jgi:sulfite oxidase
MTGATYPGNAAGLIVHSRHPYNAEPPLDRLCANLLTQSADFYIRCHGNIAHLNESAHRLRVAGKVTSPLDLSMNVLRSSFVQRSVTATLQCAGNRRGELHQVKPVTGDPWAPGAIGNARWTGVALSDTCVQQAQCRTQRIMWSSPPATIAQWTTRASPTQSPFR